ncbi:MAG: Mov34/MPN/PAD-1 family protein [Candidatus Thorarchaeota archaeon]
MKIYYEKDIIFHIDNQILSKVIKCVRITAPNEASGLIFGNVEQQPVNNEFQYHYKTRFFECVESNHKSPVAFLMNDDEMLYQIATKVEKEHDLKLISVFHSHPSGTTPSEMDYHYMNTFHKTNISKFKHLIWTIMDSQNSEIKAYLIFKGVLTQIQVKLD